MQQIEEQDDIRRVVGLAQTERGDIARDRRQVVEAFLARSCRERLDEWFLDVDPDHRPARQAGGGEAEGAIAATDVDDPTVDVTAALLYAGAAVLASLRCVRRRRRGSGARTSAR